MHYTDMQAEDYSFYQGMVFLLEHDLNEIGAELTFSTEVRPSYMILTSVLYVNFILRFNNLA